jgi:hypothetical protein
MSDQDDEFLKKYEPERTWASRHHISQRTTARYRNLPDGLPHLVWGGEIYIPRVEGADYIASRVTRRNAPRAVRRPRQHPHAQ